MGYDKQKLHIGCGPHIIKDWINCDIISFPGVDLICPADKLTLENESVDEILAEHLIEHLTYFEFNRAMAEWYRVLKPDGKLTIECPDLLGLCKQFVEGNEYKRYWTSGNYWPIINQIYGHQRGQTQEEQLSQVHKSGYTEEHLRFVFLGLGYKETKRLPPLKGPKDASIIRMECIK